MRPMRALASWTWQRWSVPPGQSELVEHPEKMQQDDHEDRHTCQPENDIAEHRGLPYATGVRRRSLKVKRAGTEVSRW
jgi:hypothetical protein